MHSARAQLPTPRTQLMRLTWQDNQLVLACRNRYSGTISSLDLKILAAAEAVDECQQAAILMCRTAVSTLSALIPAVHEASSVLYSHIKAQNCSVQMYCDTQHATGLDTVVGLLGS